MRISSIIALCLLSLVLAAIAAPGAAAAPPRQEPTETPTQAPYASPTADPIEIRATLPASGADYMVTRSVTFGQLVVATGLIVDAVLALLLILARYVW
jgi:hypothetical protein